jgi:hypothetical protein
MHVDFPWARFLFGAEFLALGLKFLILGEGGVPPSISRKIFKTYDLALDLGFGGAR